MFPSCHVLTQDRRISYPHIVWLSYTHVFMHPERRSFYPPGWKKISQEFRASKNFTCEHCGIQQGQERVSRRTGVVYKVIVAAAHVDHSDRHNPHADLKCLCPTCHGIMDYQNHVREKEGTFQRRLHTQLLTRRGVTMARLP